MKDLGFAGSWVGVVLFRRVGGLGFQGLRLT